MEKIGPYTFIRSSKTKLGTGAYSEVYLGVYNGDDPNNSYDSNDLHNSNNQYNLTNSFNLTNPNIKSGTKVAIKIMRTKQMTTKGTEILDGEIMIMQMIRSNPHPNIVECYDIVRTEEELYIVMEYCSSGDLRRILKRPLKERYAQFYFCQLVNGLKYLDQHKILHRDIKPKNILLTNKRKILKLADFGFAKKFISHDHMHETICGSPLYMAPELFTQDQYTNQTDLWSVGMILYEMLYNRNPFESARNLNELQLFLRTKQIEIPCPHVPNSDASPECLRLLEQLLESDIKKRISWNQLFTNKWATYYNCTPVITKEYETALNSVPIESPTGTSPVIDYFNEVHGSRILSRRFKVNYQIIEDYCDKVDPRESCSDLIFNFEN